MASAKSAYDAAWERWSAAAAKHTKLVAAGDYPGAIQFGDGVLKPLARALDFTEAALDREERRRPRARGGKR